MSEPIREKSQPRRGRPRSDQPGKSITLWLPEAEADRVLRVANRHGISASQVVRKLLFLRLHGDGDGL